MEVTGSWQTGENWRRWDPVRGRFVTVPRVKSLGVRSAQLLVQPAGAIDSRPRFLDLGPAKNHTTSDKDHPTSVRDYSGVVGFVAGSSTDSLRDSEDRRRVAIGERSALELPRGVRHRAHLSIAIDGRNRAHVAVGERPDDNNDARLGRSGIWESSDSGNIWTYTYDPTPDADSQGIPAVLFSPTSSALLVATRVGIARRERSATANPFEGSFVYGTPSANCAGLTQLGPITALAAGESRLWARSTTHVLWSDDDGKQWSCEGVPPDAQCCRFPGPHRGFQRCVGARCQRQ